jgi:heat shock protein HslJ
VNVLFPDSSQLEGEKSMFKLNHLLKYSHIVAVSLLLPFVFATACSGQTAGKDIIDITWQWAGLVETEPAAQSVVPDPENYTLILRPDGTLNIKADCNMVGGSYTLDGNSLTIELGPSTMAFCGEQSLDQQYLELLGRVASYTIENGRLVLNLENGAGKMLFDKG